MRIDLTDTSAAEIGKTLRTARHRLGHLTTGNVLTLVVITDSEGHEAGVDAATATAGEHPSRVLVVTRGPERETARLDAEVCLGGTRGPGDSVVMRLYGELARQAASVVVPLLVPDTPVVAYWPGAAPDAPAHDDLGALAQRRITDLASSTQPLADLARRAGSYTPGDTDLSWARITLWRSLLTSAWDQAPSEVLSGVVGGEPESPSAELLSLWLEGRLGIKVERRTSEGPGITEARLITRAGEIAITRPDGRLASLATPGWPDRIVALARRPLDELLAEELRRLDPDDVYAATLSRAKGTPVA